MNERKCALSNEHEKIVLSTEKRGFSKATRRKAQQPKVFHLMGVLVVAPDSQIKPIQVKAKGGQPTATLTREENGSEGAKACGRATSHPHKIHYREREWCEKHGVVIEICFIRELTAIRMEMKERTRCCRNGILDVPQ